MLDWIKRRRAPRIHIPIEPEAEVTKRRGSVVSAEYLSLYKYLKNRYADTVVLTFADIEGLLGFTLPDLARVRQEWWTSADPATARSSHAGSWILAGRTAKPNLLAQNVVFERVS